VEQVALYVSCKISTRPPILTSATTSRPPRLIPTSQPTSGMEAKSTSSTSSGLTSPGRTCKTGPRACLCQSRTRRRSNVSRTSSNCCMAETDTQTPPSSTAGSMCTTDMSGPRQLTLPIKPVDLRSQITSQSGTSRALSINHRIASTSISFAKPSTRASARSNRVNTFLFRLTDVSTFSCPSQSPKSASQHLLRLRALPHQRTSTLLSRRLCNSR